MISDKCRAQRILHTDGGAFWYDVESYKVCRLDRYAEHKLWLDNQHFGQARQGPYPNLLQFRMGHMFIHVVRMADLLILSQEYLKSSKVENTESSANLSDKYLAKGVVHLDDDEAAEGRI